MTARPFLDINGKKLTIKRGTAPTYTFNVTDQATGDPKNLTGATEATFVVAAYPMAPARDVTLTLGDGVETSGIGGAVIVSFATAETEALPVGNNRWAELHLTDSQGRRDVIAGYCDVTDTLTTVP